MNALEGDDVDALNELKQANELITSSLQNDLVVLQGLHKALNADFDHQKTQLIEALLTKDKALSELGNLREIMGANEDVQKAKFLTEQRMKEEKELHEVRRLEAEFANIPPIPSKSPRKKTRGILKRPLSGVIQPKYRQSATPRLFFDIESARRQDEKFARELSGKDTLISSAGDVQIPTLSLPPSAAVSRRRKNTYDDSD